MKWPLTWGKRERMFLINQFYLDSSWTWLWKEATSFSYTLKNTMTFCVKFLQNETKSFWKIFEKVCQTSNKINQFYLKTKMNWISEKCITIQCSLKVPEGSFFHFYSISPFYPTNSGIFNVVFLINIQIHLNKTWKLEAKNCAKIINSNGINPNLAL